MLGSGSVRFDFATGAVTGRMDATLNDGIGGLASIGSLQIAQGAVSRAGAGFSGHFSLGGAAVTSFLDGRFTGPHASELMARWTARVPNPHEPGTLVTLAGVWVARRE